MTAATSVLLVLQVDPLSLGLRAVLPAFAISALVLGVAWRPATEKSEGRGSKPTWGLPLALGAGLFATYVGIHGWPPADWYPDMKARLAWLGIAAGLVGLLQARSSRALHWSSALFLAVASAWLLGHWRLRGMWGWTTTLLWTTAATSIAWIQWSALERLAKRRPGPLLPLGLSLGAGLAAQSFYFAHAESHARLSAGLASVLGTAFLVALWRRGFSTARGSMLVFATLFSGLALANHLTADLPLSSLGLIALAPLGLWIGELPLLRSRHPLLPWICSLAGILLPLALAAWMTHQANPSYGADEYMRSFGQ